MKTITKHLLIHLSKILRVDYFQLVIFIRKIIYTFGIKKVDNLVKIGVAYYELKKYKESIIYFELALTKIEYPELFIKLANSYLSNNQISNAINTLKLGILKNKENKELLFELGELFWQNDKKLQARIAYKKALELGYPSNFLFQKMNKRTGKKAIIFYGHLGSNFGDIGITIGVIELLRKVHPDFEITFFTTPLSPLGINAKNFILSLYPKITFKTYNINNVKNDILLFVDSSTQTTDIINEFIENDNFIEDLDIQDVDFIFYNSGEHLFEYNKNDFIHLFAWVLPYIVLSRFALKSICLPSTFGPFSSHKGRELIEIFFKSSSYIFAREKNSLSLLENVLSDTAIPFSYGPDPAFFINETFLTHLKIFENKERIITFLPRLEKFGLRAGKEKSKDYISKMRENNFKDSIVVSQYANLILNIFKKENFKIFLVAQTYADIEICNKIFEKISQNRKINKSKVKNLIVIRPIDISSYLSLIAISNSVITSRFHSIIFGFLINKKPIGIYSQDQGQKIPGLLENFGFSNRCFSISEIDFTKVMNLIESDDNNDGSKFNLDERITREKEELLKLLQCLLDIN